MNTPINPPFRCQNCGAALAGAPEREAGDWILRCLLCGAQNVIEPALRLVGWRK